MKRHLFVFLILLFSGEGFAFIGNKDSQSSFEFFEVMADAQYAKIDYRSIITIDSPLRGQKVTSYVYDATTHELTKHGSSNLNSSMRFQLDFRAPPTSSIYLLLILEDVGFAFNSKKPATFYCLSKELEQYSANTITCSFYTTISYMLAKQKNLGPLLSENTFHQWQFFNSEEALSNQTFQNFIGMYSSLLTYITRYPEYMTSDIQNDDFMDAFILSINEYMNRISTRYYADINSLEKHFTIMSKAYSSFGYKMHRMSGDIYPVALYGMDLARAHRVYLEDFFSGTRDLNFLNRSSYRLVDFRYDRERKLLRWAKWPWFDDVIIELDGKKKLVTSNSYQLPTNFSSLKVVGSGKKRNFVAEVFTPDSLLGLSE